MENLNNKVQDIREVCAKNVIADLKKEFNYSFTYDYTFFVSEKDNKNPFELSRENTKEILKNKPYRNISNADYLLYFVVTNGIF